MAMLISILPPFNNFLMAKGVRYKTPIQNEPMLSSIVTSHKSMSNQIILFLTKRAYFGHRVNFSYSNGFYRDSV